MARPNKPWFRESKGAWYATVEGRMASLGVKGRENEAEAVKAWHRLMAGVVERAKPKEGPTVAEVVKGFLADVEARAKPNTSEVYRYYLLPFAQKYGKAKPSELTPTLAEAYSRKPTWGNGTTARLPGDARHNVPLGGTGAASSTRRRWRG